MLLCCSLHDRCGVLAYLHLHELQQLLVVNHVNLVQEHHKVLDAHLQASAQ